MDFVLQGIEPDFEFYSKSYRGRMGQAEFEAALPDALAEVDWAVWPGADLSPFEDRVKMAVCSVADAAASALGGSGPRTSYTADDVSESFGDPGFALTAEAGIRRWLAHAGVLKRGRWV